MKRLRNSSFHWGIDNGPFEKPTNKQSEAYTGRCVSGRGFAVPKGAISFVRGRDAGGQSLNVLEARIHPDVSGETGWDLPEFVTIACVLGSIRNLGEPCVSHSSEWARAFNYRKMYEIRRAVRPVRSSLRR